MTLLLIRHGETPLNVARVLQPADTPLSERGLAQARALAERLAQQPPAALLSSDLPRALQTAQAIGRACGLAVQATPLLQERNFGDLRGLPYDSLGHDPIAAPEAPPGGESAAAFHARVALAFDFICRAQQACSGALAVVTHGLVVRRLLQAHVQLPPGATLPARIGNTSLSIVAARPPFAASLLDCTRHLRAGAGEDEAGLFGG
jgi:probable phosphoglycerate mutase